jgi:hypothetical protein
VEESPGSASQLIVTSWAHGISSLDPRRGKSLWELPVFTYRVVGSPLVAAGLIFNSSGGGGKGKPFVAVRPGNPLQGTKPQVAYDVPKPAPYVPTPVANRGLVFLFGDQGVVKCLDVAKGSLRWQERDPHRPASLQRGIPTRYRRSATSHWYELIDRYTSLSEVPVRSLATPSVTILTGAICGL